MDHRDFLNNSDPQSIEHLYQQYLKDRSSVDESWASFFEGFDFAQKTFPLIPSHSSDAAAIPENVSKEFKVINLINGYRSRGHLFTRTNPVRERRKYLPTLDIENFGLSATDLDNVFLAGELIQIGPSKLKDIVKHLQETYCESIGVEYMYIRNQDVVNWLQQTFEKSKGHPNFNADDKKEIYRELSKAVLFESYLDKKFVGQKRFSLEGCESLIPALKTAIEYGSENGIKEFVVGMAHRGRLNTLANIFNKECSRIFTEFEGKEYEEDDNGEFSGDVKYHLGYHTEVVNKNGEKAKLTLSPNPSHLEAVSPVVEGITRAFADHYHQKDYNKIAPILIHGDAAIAGQGVVYEVIQMARLDGYKTGGTIHIVVNNQVGFTTNYTDARSSIYCTDVAKVTLSPVFHVNADDPEAVAYVVKLAIDFRQRFNGDVFIDLLGYRKYGHNEGDEPRFTQPVLYKAIAKHQNPREIYFKKLKNEQVIDESFADAFESDYRAKLETEYEKSKQLNKSKIDPFLVDYWKHISIATNDMLHTPVNTSEDLSVLKKVAKQIYTIPEGMKFFKKMEKLLNDRRDMIEKNNLIDWGMAELLAYGSLLLKGHTVRFSGQDVERGTFSHRHAILKIEDSEEEYTPLNHISEKQASFEIYNTLLSEYAVLGFDYGYSMAIPDALTIWEAQFGDFNNGAQIIIDQFISAAEDKWRTMSNLVMLLPHGYEGQGAEHSSARMERFLTLCAENNMLVANCTTPANIFHLLRRQVMASYRKPLIVFTPKSLLRHPKCLSPIEDFSQGNFKTVIDDKTADETSVKKVVFCTGKIYYELEDAKNQQNLSDTAIIRIEQLYPFPQNEVNAVLKKYKLAHKYIWAQEEPENMGAWGYLLRTWKNISLQLIARAPSGSPATGSSKKHAIEQKAILQAIFETELIKA